MNYTYIVECNDGSYYTGWSTDVEQRVKHHNEGRGAKYTKSRLPVRVVYVEAHETKQEAMQREYAIKQLSRRQKEELVQEYKKKNGDN